LRLAGQHGNGGAAPSGADAEKDGNPSPPAGPDADKPDIAATLFKNDVVNFDAKPVEDIFNGFANAAIGDGDGGERSRALEAARDGLIADAKANGTDAKELSDAMAIVKERQADGLIEPTPEQAEQRMAESLTALRAEGVTAADLNLARRFVADLEVVAPGTIATLSRSGAGNDPRLVRTAIREAKRRGYR
ncbi:MAG: hypothetical protein J0I13_02520, partial [Rhizobiales bacterium]|nr:hypothetical protein [Hyphomicrobiales bacterium]